MQRGGSLRQVQGTQLGGAIWDWEKGGGSELPSTVLPTPHLPKLCWAPPAAGASNTPSPSEFTLNSHPCPYLAPQGPVPVTCGEEACERLTLLKASDGDYGHLVASTRDQPLEFLGPGPAVHLHALWLP